MLTPFEEELFIGSKFAERYQILSVVGRGSMGVVYKARHELMGRLVAIKMLRGQLQMDERSIKRFEREAKAASRLDHPNVIAVHDFGLTENRTPYLVMDFASGVTLYEIQKRERVLSIQRAVHIFSQVCDALHHAHLQGVIHRDLKPSNIMVLSREEDKDYVKVFDLGVAKIAWTDEEEEDEALTNTGEVCGSPVYLSPEQCKHDALDHRTDIYSLGVVMYELLTGVPPLMGETVYDTIYLHVHEEPPAFAQVTDLSLPSRLEKIVLKALSKNPDDRHQSMQELKWDLQASMMQSDPILRVLPPDALAAEKKRPSSSPEGKESDKKSKLLITSERMRAHNGSLATPINSMTSMPASAASGDAGERKPLNPVLITALVSSVVSIAVTLGVIAMMNSQKEKIEQPEPDAKAYKFTPVKASNFVRAPKAVPPVKGTASKGSVSKAGAVPIDTNNQLPALAVKPAIKLKEQQPLSAPKEPPKAKPQIEAPVAVETPVANPFFSIFAPGKPQQMAALPSPVPQQRKQQPKAKAAPQQQPEVGQPQNGSGQQPFQFGQPFQQSAQEAPQAPQARPQAAPQFAPQQAPVVSEDVQRRAILLNNEGVALMQADPQSAIGKLQRALQLNPAYTKAKTNLGRAYHNLANQQRTAGDTFAAVNSYRHSLNLLTESVGANHPHTLTTKQDYENLLQSAGASAN